MTLAWLPNWYRPGLPLAEDAVKALLAPLFPTTVTDPGGPVQVINQLPDEMFGTGWMGRLLYIARFGGAADIRRDQAAIQIAAATNSRTESLILNGFVRDVLVCIEDDVHVTLPDGRGATICDAKETTGPEEVPGVEFDERIVPSTFLFTFDNPLEIPDYSDHLGL